MSKSSRQIAQPKEIHRDVSSLSHITQKRAISVEMRNFAQLLQRGKEHYYSNRMAEAIEVFNRGLYYDSNNVELNYWLGVAQMNMGNHSESLKYLGQVYKTNRLYKSNLLLLMAIGYKKVGQMQASLTAISEYIQVKESS